MALTTNAYIFYYGLPIVMFCIIATIAFKNNVKAIEHRLLAASFILYAVIFMFEWVRHFRPLEESAFMTTWFNGVLMVIALSMTVHLCVVLYEKHTNKQIRMPKYVIYIGVLVHVLVGLSPIAAVPPDFVRDGIWIRRDAPLYELWIASYVLVSSAANLFVCIAAYRNIQPHKKSKNLFLFLAIIIPLNALLFYALTPLIPRNYEPSILSLYVMVFLSLLILFGIYQYNLFPQHMKRYIRMFEKSPVCKFILDENYVVTEVNEQTAQYFQSMPIIGQNLLRLLQITDNDELVAPYLQQLNTDNEINNLSLAMKHYATMENVHLSINVSKIEENGQVFYYIMFRDRTIEVEQELKIRELAFFDSLTKLPNRASFMTEGKALFEREENGALLLIDLNDFKYINDTYGHAAGDKVLQATGEVLFSVAQETHFPARLGGDEFVLYVVIDRLSKTLEQFTDELYQSLQSKTVQFGDTQLCIKPSVGYARKTPSSTFEALLQEADEHMYKVKEQIKNSR